MAGDLLQQPHVSSLPWPIWVHCYGCWELSVAHTYVLNYCNVSSERLFYHLHEYSGSSYLVHGEQHTQETGAGVH